MDYKQWKINHPSSAKRATILSVLPIPNGDVQYVCTIRALGRAQLGVCNGITSTGGPHPYTCTLCNALVHCKTSTLNHKVNRSNKLKHPWSDPTHATKKGVCHKFCSSEKLNKYANQTRRWSKWPYQRWQQNPTVEPYLKKKTNWQILTWVSWNWIGIKVKGRHYRADELARSLAMLYSNKLGEKTYRTTAPLLVLPCACQLSL